MDIPTQRLIPNIWIDHDAEGAGRFYQSALPFARAAVESWYPAGADEGRPTSSRTSPANRSPSPSRSTARC